MDFDTWLKNGLRAKSDRFYIVLYRMDVLLNCFRIFWVSISLLSICFCCGMMWHLYHRYDKTPVVLNFASRLNHVKNLPFPAVTICPMIKTDETSKFSYSHIFKDLKAGKQVDEER